MSQSNENFPKKPSELEEKIGYKFKNRDILLEALRHSSYANESKLSSNERLEFLGDSVLSKIVSEYLYKRFLGRSEGDLSNIRRQIIEQKSLAAYARKIDLGSFLFLGHGEEHSGGRELDSNLEDAFESLVAAIFLDGGEENAEKFVLPFAIGSADVISSSKRLSDPKSLLQEIVQETPGEVLEYVITGSDGPDHDKTFYCEVRVNRNVIGTGKGRSKKEAEKSAAREALGLFGVTDVEQ